MASVLDRLFLSVLVPPRGGNSAHMLWAERDPRCFWRIFEAFLGLETTIFGFYTMENMKYSEIVKSRAAV